MVEQPGPPRWRVRLDLVAVILVIVTAVLALYRLAGPLVAPPPPPPIGVTPMARAEPPVPKEPVSLAGLWTKGSPAAPVAMIVFADFECPACGHFARNALPKIEREYVETGKVRLAFWHRPLPQHRRAVPAAEAAECAGQDGQFWPMHDLLFANQQTLADGDLLGFAQKVGANKFAACMSDAATSQKVKGQAAAVAPLDVGGTPTVFIGRVLPDDRIQVTNRWAGSRAFESVAPIVDALFTSKK